MAEGEAMVKRFRISSEDIRRVEVWEYGRWELDAALLTQELAIAYLTERHAEGHEAIGLSRSLIESALRALRSRALHIAKNIDRLEAVRLSNALGA